MPSKPSKLPWAKSNRSHSSVDHSSGNSSPVPSALLVNNEAAAQRFQPSPEGPQQPPLNQQPIPGGVPPGAYRPPPQQPQFPTRTSSHRLSANLSLEQQQQQQNFQQPAGPQQQHQTSPNLDQARRGSYQPAQPNPPYVQEPKKQSLRSRLGFPGHKDHEDTSRNPNKNGIGRRVSVRKSEGAPPEGYISPNLQAAQWNQRQASSQHLPVSNEQDEDNVGLDPFLQQDDHNTPQVPPKDGLQYQQQQQQQAQQQQHPQQPPPQFVQNPHQEQQYNRPPLARVNTEGSYQTQGGVEQHYSPEQHQGLAQQQQSPGQPQQLYQSYSPPTQHPQNPNEYQAFNPQAAPSTQLGNAPLHPQQAQDLPPQQQNYYQYQQQQQQAQQAQQSAQQSPQDTAQPTIQYQQQPQFSPTSQPHQGSQEFPQQHSQQVRPPSQHQPELQHPQATRPIPQIVQQGQQIDGQHVQQLRPPSSSQQFAPPSPLQPQPPPYQAYDAKSGQPVQGVDTPAQNITPPQQGQDNMPPAGTQQRNTLRKVNEPGGPPPGAPSREGSLLQQPPAQGQGQAPPQPPVSPGVPTFGANVVPTASQGQPYRGEKGQQPQGADVGRATPPPRSATDMSDEEINTLLKEHDVLREKYQKVKRYFFEQQTQVHQLQNTLAHQRLSLSRTSWDDSEYATRFNRLDGLIAQMSFAIRKDWNSIPQWLQPVVNKNAVETGKQEMTAVGRAFISRWLVDNVFDKYFHPDLEVGISSQLKSIQLNIRKFSPLAQSSEDEDALVAKVINWRLATLEGLAELLRSPQGATNRQALTDSLNANLIASLQMFLNDPAPPDLTGGVPMIVELAVSIAQHVPLESREVHIEYFHPGHSVVPEFMKIESGIPALTSPIQDPDDADRLSIRSVASKMDDNASIAEHDQQQQQQQQQAQQQAQQAQQQNHPGQPPKESADKKRSMFGFGSKPKPPQTAQQLGKRESSLGQGGSQQSLSQAPPGSSSGAKEETPPPRVRLSVGVAVQIRGKSILMKAPVYST